MLLVVLAETCGATHNVEDKLLSGHLSLRLRQRLCLKLYLLLLEKILHLGLGLRVTLSDLVTSGSVVQVGEVQSRNSVTCDYRLGFKL